MNQAKTRCVVYDVYMYIRCVVYDVYMYTRCVVYDVYIIYVYQVCSLWYMRQCLGYGLYTYQAYVNMGTSL